MEPILEYLETHVTHHCNLNCKGCGHYSNFAEKGFQDLSSYTKDLIRLRQLIPEIKEIRLLGGEPLLNKELPDFISVTRNIYCNTDLRIVTNGLLLPYANDILFHVMRNADARFDISLYPPTEKCLPAIIERCTYEKVSFRVSPKVETFCRFSDTEEPGDKAAIFSKCTLKRCHMMLNGKMAVCPLPILRQHFQKYELGHLFEEDIIDLYDPSLDGIKLVQRLQVPCKLCAYCNNHNELFTWEGNYKKQDF